jgi:uncharacterized membrane protein HdeD (DUF308 family)
MIRLIAILFGIAFIFVGVAGFLPDFTTNGLLFGHFEVDNMHNIAYIISGVIAIMAATSLKYTKWYFLIFGVLYAVAAILGFARDGDLYMMHSNMAGNFLHLGIGVVAILLGIWASRRS